MRSFKDLLKCEAGNFGIMTAVLLPVLIGSAGLAIDFAAALSSKNNAQTVADSASLAAAAALSEEKITSRTQAERYAKEIVDAHLAGDPSMPPGAYKASTTVTETTNPKTSAKDFAVEVSLNVAYGTSGLSSVIGNDKIDIAVTSTAESSTKVQKSLSMYLVLDKSGSMKTSTTMLKSQSACWYYKDHNSRSWRSPCYYSQIEALKEASADLFDTLDEVDPTHKYIRVGSIAYDSAPRSESPLSWGTDASRKNVAGLEADGNTNSTKAFEKAYDALIDQMEFTKHKNQTNTVPDRYILFMTDGANNYNSDDVATKKLCKKAEEAGIIVFGVAFNAPPKGKDLLRVCARNGKYYYDAQDADDLLAAFRDIGKKAAGNLPRLTN